MKSFRRSTPSTKQFKELSPEQERKVKRNYQSYKTRAGKKNIEFDLSYSVFKVITNLSCYYCKFKDEPVGIDRLDNDKGYVSGNCIPCCWDCNRLKSNKNVHSHLKYLKRFNSNLKVKGNPLVIRWDNNGYRLEPYNE